MTILAAGRVADDGMGRVTGRVTGAATGHPLCRPPDPAP